MPPTSVHGDRLLDWVRIGIHSAHVPVGGLVSCHPRLYYSVIRKTKRSPNKRAQFSLTVPSRRCWAVFGLTVLLYLLAKLTGLHAGDVQSPPSVVARRTRSGARESGCVLYSRLNCRNRDTELQDGTYRTSVSRFSQVNAPKANESRPA